MSVPNQCPWKQRGGRKRACDVSECVHEGVRCGCERDE